MRVGRYYGWVSRFIAQHGDAPPDTASANLVGRIIAAAVARGARRPALLDAIGISDAHIRNQLNRLPGQVLIRLFAAIEQHLATPDIALVIGRDAPPRCFSDLGYGTRFLPTLADVFEANILMQTLRLNLYRVTLNRTDNQAYLRWNLLHHDPEQLAALVEFSVATYARLAREIWGERTIIEHITLQHKARFDPQHYAASLGCRVSFGAPATAIMLSGQQLAAPSPKAQPQLCAAISERNWEPVRWAASGQRVSAFTYFYIATEINKSPVTLDRIARSAGVSERSLRRQLTAEGHPFRELLDEVRRKLCDLYQMEDKRTLSEVAELLGYGELSAFTRAAKRWYGVAPSIWWQSLTE